MKLPIITISAVLLMGCGKSEPQSTNVEIVEPVSETPAQPGPMAEAKPAQAIPEAIQPEQESKPGNPETDRALLDAADAGNIEAVKQHLNGGGNVNTKDDFLGRTPLHMAAASGYKEIVDLLVTRAANLNAKDNVGRKPLDYANGETAELLRKHGGTSGAEDSIHIAAEDGNIQAVNQHLTAGEDVNARDKDGETPLHVAATEGHNEIAELLITKGADVNAKDDNSETPLDWAQGNDKLVNLLRKHSGKTGEELKTAEK